VHEIAKLWFAVESTFS